MSPTKRKRTRLEAHKRPEALGLVCRSVKITRAHQEFLNRHDLNLSSLARELIDGLMLEAGKGKGRA